MSRFILDLRIANTRDQQGCSRISDLIFEVPPSLIGNLGENLSSHYDEGVNKPSFIPGGEQSPSILDGVIGRYHDYAEKLDHHPGCSFHGSVAA